MFERTAEFAESCRTLCDETEYRGLEESFFRKKENLDRAGEDGDSRPA
jgi:hypothetical protein